MSDQYETLLELFLFETEQLVKQLEDLLLICEQECKCFTTTAINEIFRIMHTIKGSAAMMMFPNISTLAHTMEDIFYYLREENPKALNFSELSDLVLNGVDFIKDEVDKIKNNQNADGDSSSLIQAMNSFLTNLQENNNPDNPKVNVDTTHSMNQIDLGQIQASSHTYKNSFKAVVYFEEGCEMENIRAYSLIRNLKTITDQLSYLPEDILDNDETVETIRQNGFHIYIKSDYTYDMMKDFFMKTIFLKDLELKQLENEEESTSFCEEKLSDPDEKNVWKAEHIVSNKVGNALNKEMRSATPAQSIISVSVVKLDKLMDLVGEMVISEAMVIQNPDLQGLELDNFKKAARQLNKITTEIQDMVMSIRMVPLSATFSRMHRIVRDMCKKLQKDVELEIIGDTTEVDKNIIEHISDPLMHIVRNAIDHGIECADERMAKGKAQTGRITLEAKNSGSDVHIIVMDDGKGLDRTKILKKAMEKHLLIKSKDEMTDREVFNLILLPGFSTNDNITEFSGRGVGMDVVAKNIEAVGGSVFIDSIVDKGTQITLKIPLTLAIIDGMNIKVGRSSFTIPTIAIKQSFRPKENDIFFDTDNNEMIMIRGNCYPILRLHKIFGIETEVTNLTEGIIIMVEQGELTICVFADELLGQQQVVVKTLPEYIQKFKTIKGLSGCTLLGDGCISLIIDVAGLVG